MITNTKKNIIRSFTGHVVVNELLADCRQSLSKLADSCSMNKQRVWRKIKELEKNHTIWGYSPIINENKLGYSLYLALVKTGAFTEETVEKIIERHTDPRAVGREHVQLIESYYLNGLYDWLVVFAAPSIADAKKYCWYLQRVYGEFIRNVDFLEVMFPALHGGAVNPEIEKLAEFSIPNENKK